MNEIIPAEETIRNRIFTIRGVQVMLDRDLAELYEIETRVLKQAVNRNKNRFPKDFMFQLTSSEKDKLITICDNPLTIKFSPKNSYVFTEQEINLFVEVTFSSKHLKPVRLTSLPFTCINNNNSRIKICVIAWYP
jgi:hypothetical protein